MNNPYQQNYGGSGYAYGWYPFSYGWGGYGTPGYSGFTNSGTPTDPNAPYTNAPYTAAPYDPTNSQQATGQAQQNASSAQPAAVAPTAVVPSAGSTAAQAQITNAVDRSPSLIASNNTVQAAQAAFNVERERVLASLRQKPEYQQAVARRRDASHDVTHAQQQTGVAPTNAVVSAASAKLDASDEVTKMEEQAVATDPGAAAAKARLDQATADRTLLRSQLMAQYSAGH